MFTLLYRLVGLFAIFTFTFADEETSNENRNLINECNLLVDKIQISRLGELFESELVNIVDLRMIIDRDFNETIFQDMHLTLVNRVGLKITLWIDAYTYNISDTSTLNAGRRNFELHVSGSYKECVGRGFGGVDFVNGFLQQLQGNKNLAALEICNRKRVNVNSIESQRFCKSVNNLSKT